MAPYHRAWVEIQPSSERANARVQHFDLSCELMNSLQTAAVNLSFSRLKRCQASSFNKLLSPSSPAPGHCPALTPPHLLGMALLRSG